MEQFGGKVRQEDLGQFQRSPQWKHGKFENQIETTMDFHFSDMPKMLVKTFTEKKKRSPQQPLEILPFNIDDFLEGDDPRFIWYGHSVALLRMSGKNILIDPMFGPDASPIAPFDTKRFSENSMEIIPQLPDIDVVLITHDHYDHLDMKSIIRLKEKVRSWHTPLGVSRHLEKWGISSSQITEYDWWDQYQIDDLELTFTPSRHFSGRGAFDRAKSLWGGWVIKSPTSSIYWSGDGGYGPHFKDVGEKLGPFDWGFMECGQYNEKWHAIHMYPEESVRAALDAKVKVATPVHWGGFSLAMHSWKDPVKRFINASKKATLNIQTPKIGELIRMQSPPPHDNWWTTLK